MKILSIYLVALFIYSSLGAQQPTITLKVVGGENRTLSHSLPVEGKFFPEIPKEDTLNATGKLVLPNTETVAGAYLFFLHETYRLYVMPGQSYTVTIDRKNKESPVLVEGPEQEAELALLKLNWDFSQYVGSRLYKQDAVFANNKQKVMHMLDSCLQPFEQLYKQHKMSKPFYAYAKALINNYYAAVLASVSMLPIFKAVYNKDSAGYDGAALRRLDGQVQEAIKMINLSDPATFTTDTYQEYFIFCQLMYLGYHLPLMKGKTLVKGAKSKLVFYGIEENITKEPAREYCLAFDLQSLILEKQFEVYIPDLYNEFVGQYPHSRYIKLLAAGIEKVRNFNAATKKDLTTDQQFVPDYDSIATVEELLSKFKDKVIYIDMWATWCGPCKEQFAYKKDVDPFLKSKGVEVLYLSIDEASDKQKWINMIKYYNLDGYHVMASEKLINDIRKVLGRNKDLYIPHYLICKNGKIIVKNAKRPQEKDALFKQIKSVL